MPIAPEDIRRQFPIYKKHPDLVYLDYASTALKPIKVIEAVSEYYSDFSVNIHRGDYHLSAVASKAYDDARERVAEFIGAKPHEIIFTKNTTESINIVAQSFLRPKLSSDEEILVTQLEHHSNFLPWQQLALQRGALCVVPELSKNGAFSYEKWLEKMSGRCRLAAFTHTSNVTGETLPIQDMIVDCKSQGIPTLMDAAQSAPHQCINVSELGVDFLAFSGHKCYGPTGIGVLYVKEEILRNMSPCTFGGGMVHDVRIDQAQIKQGPEGFEAGTPPIASAFGLHAAIDFMRNDLSPNSRILEQSLISSLRRQLESIDGVKFFGPSSFDSHLLALSFEGIHATDLALFLDNRQIAVRAGKHCAHPLVNSLSEQSLLRISVGATSTVQDIERLFDALQKAIKLMRK